MTIGIAVALHDAVVLVADGRRSDAYQIHTDAAEKIVRVREDLAVITFGAEIGTDMAVAWMRNPGGLPSKGPDIGDRLSEFAWASATSVLQRVPEADRMLPHIKVGLVGAGFDAEAGGFVAAGLFGSLMEQKQQVFQRAGVGRVQFIVLGGDGADARAQFESAVKKHVDVTEPTLLSDSPSVMTLVRAAEQVMRYAAERDRTIGGRGQFMILRRGQQIEQGDLPLSGNT